jgi:hypothetical protein
MIEIPAVYRWAATAGVLAVAAFLVWDYGNDRFQDGIKHEQDIRAKELLKEVTSNRETENKVGKQQDANFDKYIQARDMAILDANASRTELERLRGTLARYKRGTVESTTAQCKPDETAALAQSLENCGAAYQESADNGQRDAEQVIGLQDYIRAISPICIDGELK